MESKMALADSIPNDSINNLPPKPKGDITTTINYDAKDSLYFKVNDRKFYLYGDTHIDYGQIQLDAERTDVDWGSRTIKSYFITDSTGKKIGKPMFTDGPEVYVTDDILYNFKSKRALIKGVITEQQGGYMHGEDVRKNEDDEMFVTRASYTTCNLEDPHFSIESSKLKVIPNKKIVSGPFHMKFRDLPTPLFLPFGMFPQPKEKTSGIIVPSYGEEQLRGFFLRDGGYYFAISDYVDLRITGDIYSKGASALNTTTNYVKRYAFRGALNLSYNKLLIGDAEDAQVQNDFWVRWNHTPETRGNSSISASVSAGTQSYSENNNLVNQDIERSINSQFTSNVSYSKRFQGTPFNMSSNLRHSQNVRTGIMSLTLPDFTLNMSRIYPFQDLVKSSKSPLAKLNFSHNFVAKNEISNQAISYNQFDFDVANSRDQDSEILDYNSENLDAILDRSQIGGKHTIPISTSMSVLKFFTLNPSFSYTDLWYDKELDYTYIESEKSVRIDTLDGFSRAGSWSSGASLNTRIYGTKFFSKGKLQAVRHVMTPSLSFSYNPDFSSTKYGVFKKVQIDSTGNNFQTVSKYQGFAYGSPQGNESKTIGFSLTNNIEMKVASKKDTVNGFRKVKIFDNLGISSGYNLAAEAFKLSPININARTSFFDGKISVNFTGALDPYIYKLNSETINSSGIRSVDQERLNKYAWNNGQGLGQLSRANTTIGLNLSPRKKNNQSNTEEGTSTALGGFGPGGEQTNFEGFTEDEQQELTNIQNNPEQYVDFNVPWTLRVNYSINRTKRGFEDSDINQTLSFNGSLGLTSKTQITFNSGYDIENRDFTQTRIGVSRDLHCWTMNFNWVPFGLRQSYFFSIRVKASILQDLKLEKRRSFTDFFN
ncbi:MAG: putative LPS assembly protein LptD [Ekhidna sp.]